MKCNIHLYRKPLHRHDWWRHWPLVIKSISCPLLSPEIGGWSWKCQPSHHALVFLATSLPPETVWRPYHQHLISLRKTVVSLLRFHGSQELLCHELRPNITEDAPLTPITQEMTRLLRTLLSGSGGKYQIFVFVLCHIAMPPHLHIICSCFLLLWQSSCDRDYSLHLLFDPLWKKVAYPCPKVTPLGSLLLFHWFSSSFIHSSQGTLTYLIGQLVSVYGQDHGPLLDKIKVLKVSQASSSLRDLAARNKQHSLSLL